MLPVKTISRPPMIVSRRRGPSPRRPMIGAEIAPDSSATVSDHCALSSGMCSVRATEGIRGAPRLLMIPATIVTAISTTTSASSPPRALSWSREPRGIPRAYEAHTKGRFTQEHLIVARLQVCVDRGSHPRVRVLALAVVRARPTRQ